MFDFASLGMKVDTRDVKRAQRDVDGLSGSVKRNATATGGMQKGLGGVRSAAVSLAPALGALSAGLAVREVFRATEAWTTLNNRLRLVTDGSAELAKTQEAVFQVARDTRQPLSATAELYQRIAQNQKALNLTGQETVDLTKTISQTMVISGVSAEAASGALTQLGQAFSQGVLRGEEFNSVNEQAPGLMKALAEGVGVARGELRGMANDGQLTADVVIEALQRQADAVNDEFGTMTSTIGQAMTNVGSAFTKLIGKMDEATGASTNIADAIEVMSGVIVVAADNVDKLATAWEWFNTSEYTNVIARTTDHWQTLSELSGGVFELGRRMGLWKDSIDEAGEELERTIPLAEALTGAAEKQAKKAEEAAKEIEEVAKQTDSLSDALKESNKVLAEQEKRFQAILDAIYPQQAEVRQLANEWDFLRRNLEDVQDAQRVLDDWWQQNMPQAVEQTDSLSKALENSRKVIAEVAEESTEWEVAYERSVERMRDATGEFFQKMLVDGEASFSDLGDMFKRLVAEMAAEAATEQIFKSFGSNPALKNMGVSIGAGMIGNQLGTEAFGSTTGGGSLVGGGIGMAVGGPMGAAIGSFIGAGLESALFGNTNQGENAGRARINLATGQSTIGGVGKTFDEENVNQVQAAAQFAQRVAAVIGGSSAALDITAGRSGLTVGGTSFGQDTQGALDKIFRNVVNNADNLTESLKRLITGFDGTNEQAMSFADAIVSIDKMSTRNPVEEFRRSLDGPNSLAEAFREQVSLTDTLRTNFDGSAMAAQEYAQALGNTQQMALQLSQALNAVSQQASAQFGATAQGIRESVMGQGEINRARTAEFRELFRSINQVEGAQELSRVSARLNELINVRFGAIEDPTQQQAEFFATQAERVNDAIQQRTETLQDQTFQTIEQLNTRTQTMLQQAANTQQQAANTMNAAAQAMLQAAGRFGFNTAEVNAG